jgi:hypothetical protein
VSQNTAMLIVFSLCVSNSQEWNATVGMLIAQSIVMSWNTQWKVLGYYKKYSDC